MGTELTLDEKKQRVKDLLMKIAMLNNGHLLGVMFRVARFVYT